MSLSTSTSLLRRLKLVFSIVGVLILLGGFAKTLQSEVVKPQSNRNITVSTLMSNDLSLTVVHIQDQIAELTHRADVYEKDHEALVNVQQQVASTYLLVKYAVGALLSLCFKDIFTALINFLKAKTPTP